MADNKKNKVWAFGTKTGWFLCHRRPSETPTVGFYVPPYALKKNTKAEFPFLVYRNTKSELCKTKIDKEWNAWSAFEKMRVEPRQIEI